MGIDPKRFKNMPRSERFQKKQLKKPGRDKSQEKAWVDWLSDDPVDAQPFDPVSSIRNSRSSGRTYSGLPPGAALPPRQQADGQGVHIHVTVPKVDMQKLRAAIPARRTMYKWGAIGATAVVLIIGSSQGYSYYKKHHAPKPKTAETTAQKPTYTPLLPNKNVQETTSSKVAYDAKRKVTSYTDTIAGVQITVSQQPLPDSFKADTDAAVKKLADSFSAKDQLDSEPVAYLGTSAKGPQSVILTKNGLLIFIQSATGIEKAAWVTYINQLQ